MTDRVVCDASVIVAALLDSGPDGQWAVGRLTDVDLHAPTLVHYECANVIRRLELAGTVGADQAALAYADLLDLNVTLWPYEVLGARIWQLRQNLTSYDAAYVALAETLSATLVTLDQRIARSPGIECAIAGPT
ncbi:type II toxin-antitoxin system VapC family toxin [Mycobacterium sp. AZCC_0083]|uniref:type II toxin-antitoxin system VapC family toxin n=1 Tax=Mycobacterium sp. AZCC_0083 TaxID=2735882 RepID=UPI0016138853|nr:type II toxin-antitoxin system VapC family toxin [Mycobacterium sp. AZCC_0083]MBB5164518.1 putative nucleic acid-binding protein [Mycobacterium sp. AZCC_0083]